MHCPYCSLIGIYIVMEEYTANPDTPKNLPKHVYYCDGCFSTFEKTHTGRVGKEVK